VHVVDVRGRTELERLEDQPFCWWSLDEIAASEETFAPRDLDGSAR
jgi:predicted DNA-binding ribbon-helix-helix protein